MRPVTVTSSGVSVSPVVALDIYTNASKVGLFTKVTGSATYTLQHTADDVFAAGFDPTTANWYSSDDTNMVNATTSLDSNYNFMPRGCRINQTSGAGSVALTVIQSSLQ